MTHHPDTVNRRLASQLFGEFQGAIPTREALPGHIGRHRVVRELGRGGMGVVVEAESPSGEVVAIKVLTGCGASQAIRFRREARALAAIDHPNVARIHEVGDHEGAPFFVLEFYPGGSLADVLKAGLPEPDWVARVGVQLTAGLHAAHAQGVLHRDLKPDNVLLTRTGDPVLCDFGLTKTLVPGEESQSLTRSGTVMGTPGFLAPEQAFDRDRPATTATDVYGLGATLYALLTGRPPFTGETLVEIAVATRQQAPVPVRTLRSEVAPPLEAIVLRCLEKDPSERWSSAEELGRALSDYLSGETSSARRSTPLRALALALLVALVFGVVYALSSREDVQRKAPPLGQRTVVPQTAAETEVGDEEADARRRLERAAELGDPEAMTALGRLHAGGVSVPKNSRVAVRWFRRAAQAGDVAAMGLLADALNLGVGTQEDPRAAARWHLEAAEAGEPACMSAMGSLYTGGRGVERNVEKALHWHHKAANAGSSRSLRELGFLAGNPAEAFTWFRRAAEAGDASGMCEVGTAHVIGRGVAPDLVQAERWLRRAAERGFPAAMGRLGVLLAQRSSPDLEASMRWLREGARAGDARSMNDLGLALANRQRDAESSAWFRKAAQADDTQGMLNYGIALEIGFGIDVDRSAARRWFSKAAKRGSAEAMQRLGLLIRAQEGQGSEAAKVWLKRAAEAGAPSKGVSTSPKGR